MDDTNPKRSRARRRLIALCQAIPTLDHETTLDAVARHLRERDEALARCEVLRGLADAAAREQGLAQRRMIQAQAARDQDGGLWLELERLAGFCPSMQVSRAVVVAVLRQKLYNLTETRP